MTIDQPPFNPENPAISGFSMSEPRISDRPSYIPEEFKDGDIPDELKKETGFWTTGPGLKLNVESTEALFEAQALMSDLFASGVLEDMGIDLYAEKHESNKGHQIRAAVLCLLSNQKLPKYAVVDSHILAKAAIIHDIGKQHKDISGVFASNERYPKDHPNWELIHRHPIIGSRVAMRMPGIEIMDERRRIALAILQHHERMDGSGYPNGLSGKDICREACIMAPVDVADAIGEKRPYKDILPPKKVMGILEGEIGLYDKESFFALKGLYSSSGEFYFHRNSDRP